VAEDLIPVLKEIKLWFIFTGEETSVKFSSIPLENLFPNGDIE
jgi:hypothetical protein